MLVATWLAMFAIGWFSDRWWLGLWIAPVVAAGTTVLCLVTTNTPAFTAIEAHLSLTAQSIMLNFLAKTIYALLFYSAGYAGKRAMERVRSAKREVGSTTISKS